VLLDFLTVFFIAAGCALLWLNLRPRRSRVVITKPDDAHHSAPTRHISDEAEIRALMAALRSPAPKGRAKPEAEDNSYTNGVAAEDILMKVAEDILVRPRQEAAGEKERDKA
jgi:hypothetical protein